MTENNLSIIALSGIVAVCSYVLLILLILTQFSTYSKPKAYAAPTQTTFSIALVEQKVGKTEQTVSISQPKKEITQKLNPKPRETPKSTPKRPTLAAPQGEKTASKTANAGVGINELFAQVDTKIPINKEALKQQSKNDEIALKKKAAQTTQKQEPNLPSQENSQKQEELNQAIDKLLSNLEVKQNLTFALSEGEYDEFYAKVHEILAQHWDPWSFTNGLSSKVIVTINNRGEFSYKISQKSGNASFDQTLLEFLERMKSVGFPPYTKGPQTNIEITFKDADV